MYGSALRNIKLFLVNLCERVCSASRCVFKKRLWHASRMDNSMEAKEMRQAEKLAKKRAKEMRQAEELAKQLAIEKRAEEMTKAIEELIPDPYATPLSKKATPFYFLKKGRLQWIQRKMQEKVGEAFRRDEFLPILARVIANILCEFREDAQLARDVGAACEGVNLKTHTFVGLKQETRKQVSEQLKSLQKGDPELVDKVEELILSTRTYKEHKRVRDAKLAKSLAVKARKASSFEHAAGAAGGGSSSSMYRSAAGAAGAAASAAAGGNLSSDMQSEFRDVIVDLLATRQAATLSDCRWLLQGGIIDRAVAMYTQRARAAASRSIRDAYAAGLSAYLGALDSEPETQAVFESKLLHRIIGDEMLRLPADLSFGQVCTALKAKVPVAAATMGLPLKQGATLAGNIEDYLDYIQNELHDVLFDAVQEHVGNETLDTRGNEEVQLYRNDGLSLEMLTPMIQQVQDGAKAKALQVADHAIRNLLQREVDRRVDAWRKKNPGVYFSGDEGSRPGEEEGDDDDDDDDDAAAAPASGGNDPYRTESESDDDGDSD